MLLRRTALVLLTLAMLTGCQHDEPEAKYPASLKPCDVLPREAAVRALDVGEALGQAQPKTSHFIVADDYCQWDFKQKRKGFFTALKPGPSNRRLIVDVTVYTAKQGGATAAATRYDGDVKQQHQPWQPIAGFGTAAVWYSDASEPGDAVDRIEFHRSNVLVTIMVKGKDCRDKSGVYELDLTPAKRKQLATKVATAIDSFLLAYK